MPDFKDFKDLFYNGLLQDFSSQIYGEYEGEANKFFLDLATKFEVEKLGSIDPHGDLNQFSTKEDLKIILREIIIINGQVKNEGDYNYHEFMAKVRIATFICMARNFGISFTMEDLRMLAFDKANYGNTFSNYLFSKSPLMEILESNEVKKLVSANTIQTQNQQNQYNRNINNNNNRFGFNENNQQFRTNQFPDNMNYRLRNQNISNNNSFRSNMNKNIYNNQQFQQQQQTQKTQNQNNSYDTSLVFNNFDDLLLHLNEDFIYKIHFNKEYEGNRLDQFYFDLATKLDVKEFDDLNKFNNGDKKQLKEKLIYDINSRGMMSQTVDATLLRNRAKARVASFVCIARKLKIKFKKTDITSLIGGSENFQNKFINNQTITKILEDDNIKKLIEDEPILDYDQNDTNNSNKNKMGEKDSLGDKFYLESVVYKGDDINSILDDMFDKVKSDVEVEKIKDANANDFIYRLAIMGEIELKSKAGLDKKTVIEQLKTNKTEINYDIGGDDFAKKAKIAMFLCIAKNFGIEFSINDINSLVDNHDLIDRYPTNDMLKDEEIKKLMTGGNKISEKPSYDSDPNKSEVSLKNAWDKEKQKLAVALSQYFSYTNNQDKATAIKDLDTGDIKKIIDFDNLSKGKFSGNDEQKKRVILNFLGLYDRLSSIDENIKIKVGSIKSKISMVKDPSVLGRIFDKVLGFFSSCGKALSSFFMGAYKKPPSKVFSELNKDSSLSSLNKLENEIDKILEKEKGTQEKSGEMGAI